MYFEQLQFFKLNNQLFNDFNYCYFHFNKFRVNLLTLLCIIQTKDKNY